MREKLEIANQLRISRKIFSKDPKDKKMFSKCYHVFIIECIIKGKKDFKVVFNSKHIESCSKRIKDWFKFMCYSIFIFFLINFTSNKEKNFISISKPVHIKALENINEIILYEFLEENGLKIIDEQSDKDSIVYYVEKD